MNDLSNAGNGDHIEYTEDQKERGRHILSRLLDFIENNSHATGAWTFFENTAAKLYWAGKPISARGIIEDMREMDFADREGMPVVVDNNYGAPAARLLLRAHPEYGELLELRKSVFDVLI